LPTESSSSPLNLTGRIPELDGIRGIAIGMVLIAHFFAVVTRPGSGLAYALVPLRLDWTGVDLFFVLSGFLIGGILLDARESSNYFRVFYTRRFFRIVPIYAVLLLSAAFVRYLVDAGTIRGYGEIFVGRLSYALLYRDSWISHCLRWGWLRGLGVVAYGTYLFHYFFLGLFFGRIPWLHSWHDVGLSVVVLAVSISFCRLSWVYFEKPLVHIGHRTSYQFGAAGLAKTVPVAAEGS
jgi:peptidoglycan/LPS O-acetylase OafA/YrhL